MKRGRNVRGAWGELGGWVLVLIVLVIILLIISAGAKRLDVSLIQRVVS